MLSKNKIKLIKSLNLRKYRKKHRLFFAEGEKIVSDLLNYKFPCEYIIVDNEFDPEKLGNIQCDLIRAERSDMKKITALKTTPPVIGIFTTVYTKISINDLRMGLSIFTDDIQDPGNLGTIIRTADWFGIQHIICSDRTVDIYNPKTVQASMGAVAGVQIMYANTVEFFDSLPEDMPVYGSYMQGEDIFGAELNKNAVLILGNEGKGISEQTSQYVKQKLSIPASVTRKPASESLNVSSAAAVICSEFYRRFRVNT